MIRSDQPFTDADYKKMREVEIDYPDHPNFARNLKRHNYGLHDARKALEINPKTRAKGKRK